MKVQRRTLLVVTAVSLSALLAGCGSSSVADGSSSTPAGVVDGTWEEVVDAANAEGEVTIYATVSPDNLESLKQAFEAEYPDITLTYLRGTDADIIPRVEVENETGQGEADMHLSTDSSWIDQAAESQQFSHELVPGPAFDNPDYDKDESVLEDTFFLASGTVFGLAWNTNLLPNGLEEPEDLLTSELAGGKIGISNPSGIPTYVDMYSVMDEDWGADGESYLDALAELDPRVYDSAVAITAALGSGEVAATPMAGSVVLTEKEKGAPVDLALPSEPWGVPWYGHVLKAGPNPNAGMVLADFIITESGQEALSADYVAALPDVEGTGVPGSDITAQDLELWDPSEMTPEHVQSYQAEWEARFFN